MNDALIAELEHQIGVHFGLSDARCQFLETPVNDVVVVDTAQQRYALKVYHLGRTPGEVQWETDLVNHLIDGGAPIAAPVAGVNGSVETIHIDGLNRHCVLYEWAPGSKPMPSHDTYGLLGDAAARLHRAADTFTSPLARRRYSDVELIDEQLMLIQPFLIEVDRWNQSVQLGERLRGLLRNASLDWGICHMDLTLDNVHREADRITVFDLDSAGECWRAMEPHGVLRFSPEYFDAWLDGYRSVRPFSSQDERAVAAFCILGELRATAWKLGVADSSRGTPLMDSNGLAVVIDEWLKWNPPGSLPDDLVPLRHRTTASTGDASL